MGHADHRRRAPQHLSLAVITVSDTRRPETDESGDLIDALCRAAGHVVAVRRLVPDEPDRVREELSALVSRDDVQAVLVNGGTGISARDRTFEAIDAIFDKRIEGFGELFRALSFARIGPAAMLSRAAAGVVSGKPVFSMPGAPDAVALAMERLILPEIGHAVAEAGRTT